MALIFDIKHFSIQDGNGIRTTVFFKGCPLNCMWCHNREGINPKKEQLCKKQLFDSVEIQTIQEIGREMSVDQIMKEVRKDVHFYNSSAGGVTFSGGEPLMQEKPLMELLKLCKEEGINTALDTSGYICPSSFERVVEKQLIDTFLFDIKVLDSDTHKRVTGCDNNFIITNFMTLLEKNIDTVLRLPMIPDISFTTKNISDLLMFLERVRHSSILSVSLLPYHTTAKEKHSKLGYEDLMKDAPSLHEKDMNGLKKNIEELGYRVNIGF